MTNGRDVTLTVTLVFFGLFTEVVEEVENAGGFGNFLCRGKFHVIAPAGLPKVARRRDHAFERPIQGSHTHHQPIV